MREPTARTQTTVTGLFSGWLYASTGTTPLKVGPGGRAAFQIYRKHNVEKYIMQFEMNLCVGDVTPDVHAWARIPDHYMEYTYNREYGYERYKPYSPTRFITGASMVGHLPQDTWVRAQVYQLNPDTAAIRIRVTTS